MDLSHHNAGRILRAGVESKEKLNDPYLKDLTSYVEHVFEPLLYHEIDSIREELPNEIEDVIDAGRDIDAELEKEMVYWADRFGIEESGVSPPGSYFDSIVESLDQFEDFGTVVSPAVGGIGHGIIARDILGVENYVIVGYVDKTRGKSREAAFKTGEAEGDILCMDDTVNTGASIVGVLDALNAEESKNMAIDSSGTTYEEVKYPGLRQVLHKVDVRQSIKPDRFIKNRDDSVSVTDSNLVSDGLTEKFFELYISWRYDINWHFTR